MRGATTALGYGGLAQLASFANRSTPTSIWLHSFRTDDMTVVVPCSMRTLAAVAHGLDNKLTRWGKKNVAACRSS
ncbi:hypothetical protein EOD04_02755 [Mesorhizobium sp. M2C.T.Ca.TU.009.01.2.1]|nr:hypothetical protein EOD07_35330 [Mesorhizobium sp. M2C.T.Ca.TU.002.02.1.1]RUU71453.1 hypothetical protein EOD04_02755 [Mesorhizobium sp. M2C.T.Ca.TU.009.01.2.1]